MQEYIDKIKNLKRTYIELSDIEEIYKSDNYMDFFDFVNTLIRDGVIMPMKNNKNKNGKIPSLFIRYRILKDTEEFEKISYEIKHLAPEFKIDKYIKNMNMYKKHREILLKLDKFIKNEKEKLKIKLSKNERAYQIWNYEKMLDNQLVKSVISYNELNEVLNYYLTPEPFFDYIPKNKSNMTILIIENKDAWYTLRKIIKEKNSDDIDILGQKIDGLVYGEGNKITKENAVYEYQQDILNQNCRFIYWGDLDFSGIDLYQRVKKANSKIDIELFSNIYETMINLSERRELNEIKNRQNKIDISIFLSKFKNEETKNRIEEILKNNKYIPQEILNYEELLKIIK